MTDLERLPGSPGCFICDNNNSNPRSLHLKIFWDESTQTVKIPFTPDETWCGYNNIVHGGLLASVLDEVQAWVAKQKSGDWAFTVDYHLRYKKALNPGREYLARGTVDSIVSRKITTKAEIVDSEGTVYALADAVFLASKNLTIRSAKAEQSPSS